MAGHEWDDWFEREEFIGQISDIRVQNLQAERESIQKRTFTRWMNLHLEKCNPPLEITDLFGEIRDGRILMALLEELSGCKLLHEFKPSSHRIFRLNNIAKVLTFLEERNVKLISIDAADVADGNSSLVLGLIWNIILFFQIKELTGTIQSRFSSTSSLSSQPNSTDSDTSHPGTPAEDKPTTVSRREHGKAIRTLLHWVQKRTAKYGVVVQDFGKSWTSGLAFLAVIKSIDSSLVDIRKARLRTPRQNIEDAFRIAHYSLGIPRLLEPEDVMISAPDEQSIMTYVSQFLEHFPGYDQEETSETVERSFPASTVTARQLHGPANGLHRERRRPYMARKDLVPPPPKIFVSSAPDDFEQPCPADEDVPVDTKIIKDKHKEGSSESPRRPPDLGKRDAPSPKPSCVDSAIGSPDSWSEVASEVALLDSPGLFNDSTNPSSPDELQESKVQEPLSKMSKTSEDQVFPVLFTEKGNASPSSLDRFQTNSKFSLEEEDAYQYILDLNDEKRDNRSLSRPCDQQDESVDSPSSEPVDASVTQSHDKAYPLTPVVPNELNLKENLNKMEKNGFQPPPEQGAISPLQTKGSSEHSFQMVCVAPQKTETHVDCLSGVNEPETTLQHPNDFTGLSAEVLGMGMEGCKTDSKDHTGMDFANVFSHDRDHSECQFEIHNRNQSTDCSVVLSGDQEQVRCLSDAQDRNRKENHLASISEDQKNSGSQSMAQDENHNQDNTSTLSEVQKLNNNQSIVHKEYSHEDSITAVFEDQDHSRCQFEVQDKDQNRSSSFFDQDYPFDLLNEKDQRNHLASFTKGTGLMHETVEGMTERGQMKDNELHCLPGITEAQDTVSLDKLYHSDSSLCSGDGLGDLNICPLGRNEPSRMSTGSPNAFTLGETNDSLFDYSKPCNMSYSMYEDIVEEASEARNDPDPSYLISMDSLQESNIDDYEKLPVLDSPSEISCKGQDQEEQTSGLQLETPKLHCAVQQEENVGARDDPHPFSHLQASQQPATATSRQEQQTLVTAAPPSDVSVAELHVLLLLWLLLYCLFVLPQLDPRTLPRLLLNLEE